MIRTIRIDSITNRFDVRRKIDEDHVLLLAGLIEAKTQLPPIKVISIGPDQYAFIDGRHRAAAYSLVGYETLSASVSSDSGDVAHYFGEAMRSNWGGAKPPLRTDLEYTVTQMLDQSIPTTKIRESLNFIPASLVRQILTNSASMLRKRRINRAMEAVADGSRVADAAQKYGLDPETIKQELLGKKRAKKDQAIPLSEIKSYISRVLKAANNGIAKRLETIMKEVEDGETPASTALLAVEAWQNHLRGTLGRMPDWHERVEMLDRTLKGR
jgi:FtsZ-binding cell division protein ZapB